MTSPRDSFSGFRKFVLKLRSAAFLTVPVTLLTALPAASQQESDLSHLMGMPYQYEGSFIGAAEWLGPYNVPQATTSTTEGVRVQTRGAFRLLPELVTTFGVNEPQGVMGDAKQPFRLLQYPPGRLQPHSA